MAVRQAQADETLIPRTWLSVREVLKRDLRALWCNLLGLRKIMGISVCDIVFPRWEGNDSPIWKETFAEFVGPYYNNILLKIAFAGTF
jgi:hypothetical protein